MKILYAEEHSSCFNYSSKDSLIKIEEKSKGEVFHVSPNHNEIVLLSNGEMSFSTGLVKDKIISGGKMFVHPNQNKGEVEIKQDSTFFIIQLASNPCICKHSTSSFEKTKQNETEERQDIFLLEAIPIVNSYFSLLETYIKSGLRCSSFYELKIKELIYVLCSYYGKEDINMFFQPILNENTRFSLQVMNFSENSKTVKELCEKMNYKDGRHFEQQFKETFKLPANEWLEQKNTKKIYNEIRKGKKTVEEIACEYQFTLPQFNKYCKQKFNLTPEELLEKSQRKEIY